MVRTWVKHTLVRGDDSRDQSEAWKGLERRNHLWALSPGPAGQAAAVTCKRGGVSSQYSVGWVGTWGGVEVGPGVELIVWRPQLRET